MLCHGSNKNIFVNNICLNNSNNSSYYADINIYISPANVFFKNILSKKGLLIEGTELKHYNTHEIEDKNTVNGKPIIYWKNRTSGNVPEGGGQVILANCTNVQLKDQYFTESFYPILIAFTNSSKILDNYISKP